MSPGPWPRVTVCHDGTEGFVPVQGHFGGSFALLRCDSQAARFPHRLVTVTVCSWGDAGHLHPRRTQSRTVRHCPLPRPGPPPLDAVGMRSHAARTAVSPGSRTGPGQPGGRFLPFRPGSLPSLCTRAPPASVMRALLSAPVWKPPFLASACVPGAPLPGLPLQSVPRTGRSPWCPGPAGAERLCGLSFPAKARQGFSGSFPGLVFENSVKVFRMWM